MDKFFILFLYLFIYSFLGWIVETIYCRILDGKWTNRGFLFGPYCPIYGFGALIIICFLRKFEESPLKVFLFALLFTSILEYLTSYILEKMFNAKWWDYSDRKYNLNGRICLLNSLEFGVLGLVITYFIHPNISSIIELLPNELTQLISIVLLIIMSVDTCTTVITLANLKDKLAILHQLAEKIKKQHPLPNISDFYLYRELSEFRKNFLARKRFKRILDAFPSFEFKEFKKQINELKLDLHKLKNNKDKN